MRIVAFICVSLAIHALTLNIRAAPAGLNGPHAHAAKGAQPALRAALERTQNGRTEAPTKGGPEAIDETTALSSEGSSDTERIQNDTLKNVTELRPVDGSWSAAFDKWHTAQELDVRAEPLTPVELAYPMTPREHRVQGYALISLFIDEMGLVRRAKVVASRPDRIFGETALKSWDNIRFSPALIDGQPVKSEKRIEIAFTPD